MSDYKPYRILRKIVAVVNDGDDTRICYPHGKVGSRMKATGKVGMVFSEGVIDAPTKEEVALFSLPALSKSVKPIPQDPRGFDTRLSGVARSIAGSRRGREAGVVEKFERKATETKRDLDKKPEAVIEVAPKPKDEAKPEIKLEPESKPKADIKAKAGAKPKLQDKPGAAKSETAKKSKPAIDETKKEGDKNE